MSHAAHVLHPRRVAPDVCCTRGKRLKNAAGPDCPLTSYTRHVRESTQGERKGTKHPFAMLVLAPFSFAFTGPSVRLSAPSAGVSKVSMNLFDNFGRTDGVSKVSMPRPEG